MNEICEHSIPVKLPHTVDRVIDGEALVVEPNAGMVNVLNPVATRIWELIDGRQTIGEIIDMICEEYEMERAVVSRDAMEFLHGLRDKGWIEVN